jgi:hypothetical protein
MAGVFSFGADVLLGAVLPTSATWDDEATAHGSGPACGPSPLSPASPPSWGSSSRLSELTARPLPEALSAAGVLRLATFGPGLLLLATAMLSGPTAVWGAPTNETTAAFA